MTHAKDVPAVPAVDDVLLLVEGSTDQLIVEALGRAAKWDSGRLRVIPAGGKYRVGREAERLAHEAPGRCAVLVDLDASNVPDAQTQARQQLQLGDTAVEVFCAVPTIEAWLFADDEAVLRHASHDEDVRRLLARLPLPEEIPDPRELAARVFGRPERWDFLSKIDVDRAAARSPSLRRFVEGLGTLLGSRRSLLAGVSRSLSRDALASLIREVSPAEAVLWRTAPGATFSAAQLQRHVESGDDVGRQYAEDLLRVARDLLRRTAARGSTA